MARRLIAEGAGSFHRVLTDPRDGAPLEIGRTSYRLTTAQRHWLRLRDGRCPFPGCANHSLDNEADHLLAWADGGTTGISNLGQPCPKHHRLKHTSAWTPYRASKDHPPGWTSPSGRYYPSEHQDWEPPRWPEDWLPHIPATDEPGPEPDPDPDQGQPADPGHRLEPESLPDYHPGHDPIPEPDIELPPDPFPDWHQFIGRALIPRRGHGRPGLAGTSGQPFREGPPAPMCVSRWSCAFRFFGSEGSARRRRHDGVEEPSFAQRSSAGHDGGQRERLPPSGYRF